MSTALTILGALIGLGGAVAGVVLYLRRSIANAVDLRQTNAAPQQEQQRLAAVDAAQRSARAERAKEFNEKAAAVRTARDAARLLEDTVTGDSEVN